MKKVMYLLLSLVLIALLIGCGPSLGPDEVVDKYWTAYDSGEEIEEFIVSGREDEVGEELNFEDMDSFEEIMWDRVNLEIFGYEEDDDIAMVDAEFTKPDFEEIADFLSSQAFENQLFGKAMRLYEEGLSDAEVEQELEEKAEEIALDTIEESSDISHSGKVELHLVNNEWKIYDFKFEDMEERLEAIQF